MKLFVVVINSCDSIYICMYKCIELVYCMKLEVELSVFKMNSPDRLHIYVCVCMFTLCC